MTQLHVDAESRDDLTVGAGTQIVAEVPEDGDVWQSISRLHPSEEVLDDLMAIEDTRGWPEEWPDWVRPIDTGITFNGEPWGWTMSWDDYESGGDDCFLLPVGFFNEVSELAATSMWQSASMTGAVIPTTCLSSNGVHYAWQVSDDEGIRWRTMVLSDDLERTARDFIALSFSDWGAPVCPTCDQSGWEITIGLAPEVRDAVGPAALAAIWVPCTEHVATARVELDGWWRWDPDAVDAASDTLRRDAAKTAAMWRRIGDSIDAQLEPETPTARRTSPEPVLAGAWAPTQDGPDDDPEPTSAG